MDRQYIRDHQVVERYLQGKLSADEEQAFEEVYLGDPELLDELERVEGLKRAMQELDANGGLVGKVQSRPWLSALHTPQYAVAASVALAASLVLSSMLYLDNRSLRFQSQSIADVTVSAVLPLLATRGAAFVNELVAPASDEVAVLLIDAGFEEYDDYRVIIARTDGDTREVVMSRDGLAASLVEGVPRVPVALTGETLSVGNYEIELFGRMMDWPADREYVRIADDGLRVTPPQ